MPLQFEFREVAGITLDLTVDEHGGHCVVVTGHDYDAVYDSALAVKNVLPVEHCPEVGDVLRDIESGGRWCAHVRMRRPS